jgi:hypothetical protein
MQNDAWSLVSKRTIAVILSPIGVLLLSAARLIVVSNYNTTTAITVASSGGYINTLLGSIIPLVPVFAPYLALALLLFKRFFLGILTLVFAALITPTRISATDLVSLAKADWSQLVTLAAPFSSDQLAIVLVLAIVAIFWFYHRSFIEAASIVAVMIVSFALLMFTTFNMHLSTPVMLHLASAGEHKNERIVLNWGSDNLLLAIIVLVAVVWVIWLYYRSFPGALTTIVAIASIIALYPYISNIYPVPRQGNYYVDVLHQLWLPAEKIVVSPDRIYYGYILSSNGGWDTVLLTNRTISYLPADSVVHRSVCQPSNTPAPPAYPPLVPILYSQPPPTPACASSSTSTTFTFVRSHGQSLREIAEAVHRSPWTIISVTNAHEHEELSAALRAYERARDWNAPTPIGQRFWYYPRITP